MKADDIFKGRKKRAFFDSGSTEYASISIEDKIYVLAQLNYHGLFDSAIQEYVDYYNTPNYQHVINELPKTMLSYLNYLQFNKLLPINRIDLKNEQEIYQKLKEILSEKYEIL